MLKLIKLSKQTILHIEPGIREFGLGYEGGTVGCDKLCFQYKLMFSLDVNQIILLT